MANSFNPLFKVTDVVSELLNQALTDDSPQDGKKETGKKKENHEHVLFKKEASLYRFFFKSWNYPTMWILVKGKYCQYF